jgi:hypothetical protein
MDDKIQLVKSNFNKIKEIRIHVMNCFNALENKLTKLKNTTNDFIKNNKHDIFFFGLDSFQFQGKLIDYEYTDMKKFYFALNNRMYCEYYKLFKLILNYTEEVIGTNKNIEMLKKNNIFPVYKDLEPLKQYNFETIEELHKTIIILLNDIIEHIISKEHQLQIFQLKQNSGLNINNFVNTFDFDVIMIKQKCLLYLSYLEFFHTIHTKHFKRFAKKMKLMNDYLDEDITFDDSIQHNNEDESVISPSNSSNSSISSTIDTTDTNDKTIAYNSNSSPKPSLVITDHKSQFKSLFKTNVNKVINSFKITKSNSITANTNLDQNMTLTVDDIDVNIAQPNINDMLDTLTDTCNEVLCKESILVEADYSATNIAVDEPIDEPININDIVNELGTDIVNELGADKKKRKRNKKKK